MYRYTISRSRPSTEPSSCRPCCKLLIQPLVAACDAATTTATSGSLLLRAARERPTGRRCRRAAEQRDELAPSALRTQNDAPQFAQGTQDRNGSSTARHG